MLMHQPLCPKMNTTDEILETEVVIKAPGKTYKWRGHETSAKIIKKRQASVKRNTAESDSSKKKKPLEAAKENQIRKVQKRTKKRSLPKVSAIKFLLSEQSIKVSLFF